MTRLILTILCGLHLSACGQAPTDPTFGPYVQLFNQAAQREGTTVNANHVTVRFFTNDELANDYQTDPFGDCQMGKYLVRINPQGWAWMSGMNPPEQGEALKEELIMHELGHCVLFRQHNPTMASF